MQPPQQIRGKEFNPSAETSPGVLQKDMRPTEVTEWKCRFHAYLEDGTQQGQKVTLKTTKRVLERLCDEHWKNRIGHKLEGADSWEEISNLMDIEMEITFPIMGRRATLMSMNQRSGQCFSDFYREVEKQADECRLKELTPSDLVGHLALICMSDKVL